MLLYLKFLFNLLSVGDYQVHNPGNIIMTQRGNGAVSEFMIHTDFNNTTGFINHWKLNLVLSYLFYFSVGRLKEVQNESTD